MPNKVDLDTSQLNKTPLTRLVLILASFEMFSSDHIQMYEELCEHFGKWKVRRKMETLVKHGYLKYGLALHRAWLTDNGRKLLKELNNANPK